jgi:GntR family transcriptional regulator
MKTDKTIDRESKVSLYVQIYSIFKEKITTGEWPTGTQIPAEDELCETYDVSKSTVREAIYELVREGYLKRLQGKGTFVIMSAPHHGLIMRTRKTDDVYREGATGKKEIIARGKKEASADIKKLFVTEDYIYYVLCKKMVDSETYLEELFIPLFLVADIENKDILCNSIYDLIESKGTKKVFKVLQTAEVISIMGDIAVILNKEEGAPALLVSRILLSSDGSQIGYMRLIGSGSQFKFQMAFERIK